MARDPHANMLVKVSDLQFGPPDADDVDRLPVDAVAQGLAGQVGARLLMGVVASDAFPCAEGEL
jgi:hypothetical protein